MLNNEALFTSRSTERPTLSTFVCVLHRILIGPLSDGEALQTDRKTSVVHHREHVAHAFVFFTDKPSDRAGALAVRHHAGRRTVDAELVLDRHTTHVILLTDRTIGIEQEFWNKEHRDAFCSGRRSGGAGEDQVDDLVGHVMFTKGDPDFCSGDLPRAVADRLSFGAHRTNIATCLRFRQVHGASPLTGQHFRQVGLFLLLGPVRFDGVDGALRQQRAECHCHVCAVEHFLNCESGHPRKSSATVFSIEWHCAEAGRNVLRICRLKGIRCGDTRIAVPLSFDVVAVSICWCDHF